MTCANCGTAPESGSSSGDYDSSSQSCTYDRKLCVYCAEENSNVYIYAMSNGLPNHCYVSPRQAPVDLDFDIKVRWMKDIDTTTYTTLTVSEPAPSVGFWPFGPGGGGGGGPGGGGSGGGGSGSPGDSSASDITPNPTTQDELDELICNIFRS